MYINVIISPDKKKANIVNNKIYVKMEDIKLYLFFIYFDMINIGGII